MDYGPLPEEPFAPRGRGVFVTSEGNFRWDNASLSFYDPDACSAEDEVFLRANGMKLGDVAQSMAIRGDRGYVVVNYSGRIYIINTGTFELTGVVEDLFSPRYIHFPNDTTAYVTDLYDPHITVFDTRTNHIRGRISTNGHKSTEQMAQWNDEVFTNCWSYDNKILVVDAAKELVVDEIEVGWQPTSLAMDRHGKLWTATEAGRDGSLPAIWRIDAATRAVEKKFPLPADSHPMRLTLNGTRDTLYYIDRAVWRMPVVAESLPAVPFLPYAGTLYYGLGVDPLTSEVYVADAIDYRQHGMVYRFTARGQAVDEFRVGITPNSFCFK